MHIEYNRDVPYNEARMSPECPRCLTELPKRARYCPRCGQAEPEFRAWRRRVNTRIVVFCAIAIVVGLCFLPARREITLLVSGLGLLGVIHGLIRLSRLSG